MDYKVKFEVFEGPLDLLLYLIKKEEVDIYEVNLTKLATQFLEYLDLMRMLDLDIAGEFLVMAATLMYIKSRDLLPKDQQVKPEGEDGEDDPRWELIKQLIQYKKFKDAAANLQKFEIEQENIYPRLGIRAEIEAPTISRQQAASIFDLLAALNRIIKNLAEKSELLEITDEKWTVGDKIEQILNILAEKDTITFSSLFESSASRTEIVTTFLALLELIRLRQISAYQPEEFGEIEISRAIIVDTVQQNPQSDNTNPRGNEQNQVRESSSTPPESSDKTDSVQLTQGENNLTNSDGGKPTESSV